MKTFPTRTSAETALAAALGRTISDGYVHSPNGTDWRIHATRGTISFCLPPQLLADYTAPTKRRAGALTFYYIFDNRREVTRVHECYYNKREAREAAKACGAEPYNF